MLPAGGSCLLGALNLAAFVNDGKFDYNELIESTKVAIRALNDVLDEGMDKHPLQEQRESVREWRQIGLGIMGLADMLIKMGVKYGSPVSIELCNSIGDAIAKAALETSAEIAKEKGIYPKYTKEVLNSSFYKHHPCDLVKEYGLHNSQLLTIAPTGSISTMLGVSGGIEPIFANSYTRMTKSLHGHDEAYKVYTPIVDDYMKKNKLTDESELPEYFVTSADIAINDRIAMQSIWQSHIDASISSTINLPHEATIEDVEKLYMRAWECGLKGVTVYRAGCAREGILTTNNNIETLKIIQNTKDNIPRGVIVDCSDDLIGKKRKLTTGCGSLHVLAYFDPVVGDLQEVYLSKGSTGGCQNFMVGLSRTISLLCRAGVDIETIKNQLDSTGACPSYSSRSATKHDTSKGSCCPMAIGNALLEMYNEMKDEIDDEWGKTEVEFVKTKTYNASSNPCPECGAELRYEGGCNSCPNCGYSKCN